MSKKILSKVLISVLNENRTKAEKYLKEYFEAKSRSILNEDDEKELSWEQLCSKVKTLYGTADDNHKSWTKKELGMTEDHSIDDGVSKCKDVEKLDKIIHKLSNKDKKVKESMNWNDHFDNNREAGMDDSDEPSDLHKILELLKTWPVNKIVNLYKWLSLPVTSADKRDLLHDAIEWYERHKLDYQAVQAYLEMHPLKEDAENIHDDPLVKEMIGPLTLRDCVNFLNSRGYNPKDILENKKANDPNSLNILKSAIFDLYRKGNFTVDELADFSHNQAEY